MIRMTVDEWIRGLGPIATRNDAWRLCYRGDWMLAMVKGSIARAAAEQHLEPLVLGWVKTIIRATEKHLRGVREPWATEWRAWAKAVLADGHGGNSWGEASSLFATSANYAADKDRRHKVAWLCAEACLAKYHMYDLPAAADNVVIWHRERDALFGLEKKVDYRLSQANSIRRVFPKWPGGPNKI